MRQKNSNQSTTGLVQRYIGSAYDTVRVVADSLPAITEFTTRNMGASDVEPSVRNDGTALKLYDTYLNTIDNLQYMLTSLYPVRIWTPTNLLRTRTEVIKPETDGANQVFNLGADYTPNVGELRVHLNGMSLLADYDAHNYGLTEGDYTEVGASQIQVRKEVKTTDTLTIVRTEKISTFNPAVSSRTGTVVIDTDYAGEGDAVVNLPDDMTYDMTTGNLTVYRNGLLLSLNHDYTEESPTSIRMVHLSDDDVLTFRVGDVVTSGLDDVASGILRQSRELLALADVLIRKDWIVQDIENPSVDTIPSTKALDDVDTKLRVEIDDKYEANKLLIDGLLNHTDTLDSRITTVEPVVAATKTQTDTNTADISTHTAQITGIHTKDDTQDATLVSHSTQLVDHNTRITANRADITTNTHNITTVTTEADKNKADIAALDHTLHSEFIPLSQKAKGSGVATLDASGKLPAAQLPNGVDLIEEYPTFENFPETGETHVIYFAIDINTAYRWGGTAYISLSGAGLKLGETEATAYRGDHGKEAHDKAVAAYALADSKITKAQGDSYYLAKTGKAVSATHADAATTATHVTVQDTSINTNTYFPVWHNGANDLYTSKTQLTYTPKTGVLTTAIFAGRLLGKADFANHADTAAIADIAINATHATKADTISYATNTDAADYGIAAIHSDAPVIAHGVSLNPHDKSITATTFKGHLVGKADSATHADTATTATNSYTKTESEARYFNRGKDLDGFSKLVSPTDHTINPKDYTLGWGVAARSGANGSYVKLSEGGTSLGSVMLAGDYDQPYYLVSWTDDSAVGKRVQKIYTDHYKPTAADVGAVTKAQGDTYWTTRTHNDGWYYRNSLGSAAGEFDTQMAKTGTANHDHWTTGHGMPTGAYNYGITANFAGNGGGAHLQIYSSHHSSTSDSLWFRTGYGTSKEAWARIYSTNHKPTAHEVGAVTQADVDVSYKHGSHSLPAHTDLNKLTTLGFYHTPASATAATFLNCPTKAACSIQVTADAGTQQRVQQYNSSYIWTRSNYAGHWTPWYQQYNVQHKPSAHDVGTLTTAEIKAEIAKEIAAHKTSALIAYPVGSCYFSTSATNPATILGGGTWSLLTSDATVIFGNGHTQTGAAVGSNTVSVPVVSHTHTAHSTFKGVELPQHSHEYELSRAYDGGHSAGDYIGHGQNLIRRHGSAKIYPITAGTPAGTVATAVSAAGVASATMNVRGRYVILNVWRRTK